MKFKSDFLCSICGLGEIYSVLEYTLLYFCTSRRHVNISAINYVVSGSLGRIMNSGFLNNSSMRNISSNGHFKPPLSTAVL